MYDRDQVRRGIRRGVRNPAYFGRELNRLYHRRLYRREFNPRGVDVVAAEWDNLVILDACRYDDFAQLHDLEGDLESRESRGSHTVEFLRGNFAGRELLDTVYVTASPQLSRKGIDVRFHAVENVWEGESWDEEAGTVRPEAMAKRGLAAAERYPHKRLILHFVQPHYPFLGDDLDGGSLLHSDGLDVWGELMRGTLQVRPAAVRAAYRENLELALAAVEGLLDALEGRTVVTADHGNLFDERTAPVPVRDWGHPPGLYVDQLVEVPWFVSENGVRGTRPDPPAADGESEGAVDPGDRLAALGYVE